MRITNWRTSVAVAAVALGLGAGCSPALLEGGELDGERETFGPKLQGSSLHGGPLGDFRVNFAAALAPDGTAMTGWLNKGSLEGSGGRTGAALVGSVFSGISGSGGALKFKIMAWSQHHNPYVPTTCDAPGDDSDYVVRYKVGAGAYKDFCTGGGLAIAVTGYWNAAGDHTSSMASFTFSCLQNPVPTAGVITKCFDWCYKPYLGGAMEHLHFACTRMARADICAVGKANTIDNTFIDSWDVAGVVGTDCTAAAPGLPQSNPATACTDSGKYPVMEFEAAWRAGWSGANNEPKEAAAICLSKKRWQTIPVRGFCETELIDPRDDDRGKYCDDFTQAELIAAGALHFNYSGFYDIGLYRVDKASDSFVSSDSTGTTVPSYASGLGYTTITFEGALWRQPPTNAVLLATYQKGGDFRTSTKAPAGYTLVRNEGYCVDSRKAKPTSTARLLYCYSKGADFLTTTQATAPAGYSKCTRRQECWLPY
ncbi:MAG: hypothetical protein EXR72_17855 [Myxococcales bacterium]|nr:hypothetical protein [Myxococcales bacterium]